MHPFSPPLFPRFQRQKNLSKLSQFHINLHLNYFYFIWKNVYLVTQP